MSCSLPSSPRAARYAARPVSARRQAFRTLSCEYDHRCRLPPPEPGPEPARGLAPARWDHATRPRPETFPSHLLAEGHCGGGGRPASGAPEAVDVSEPAAALEAWEDVEPVEHAVAVDVLEVNRRAWDRAAPRFCGGTALPVYGPLAPT